MQTTPAGRFSPFGLGGVTLSLLECRMASSEDYKSRAEECRHAADQAHDEIARASLLRMAKQWERLAQHKAKIEVRADTKNSN